MGSKTNSDTSSASFPVVSTLVFVIPDGSEEISGGNLYNAELLAALESGSAVQRMTPSDFASRRVGKGTYLIDTLNLDVAKEALARRRVGQRFVLLVHHLPSFEPDLSENHASCLLEREILGAFDGYIATGEFTRAWLAEQGFAKRTILVEPVMAKKTFAAREFARPTRAVMVCNLIPRKGVLAFLDGLAEKAPSGPDHAVSFSLDIIGRTDLDSAYARECAHRLSSDKFLSRYVRLLGPLPHSAVDGHYERANLFLSASRMETFGISLQEARFHGLPILAVGGGNSGQHVRSEVTGEIHETPRALAGAFLRLVQTPRVHASYFHAAQRNRPAETETWNDAARRLRKTLATWEAP